jgi:rhodanese-related sulfurtransferase
MTSPTQTPRPRFERIDVAELAARLESDAPPLVLDVRTRAAFGVPPGIPGALPVALDRDPLRLPDVARSRPIVAYCL